MSGRNKLYRAAIAVVVAGILSACASTHGLAPQSSINKPDTLQTSATLANTPVSNDAWPQSQWWTQFQDPQLDQLIAEGLAGSPTMRVAEARTRAALAQARVAQAARLPQVDAKGSVTRERFPEQSLIPPPYGGCGQLPAGVGDGNATSYAAQPGGRPAGALFGSVHQFGPRPGRG